MSVKLNLPAAVAISHVVVVRLCLHAKGEFIEATHEQLSLSSWRERMGVV